MQLEAASGSFFSDPCCRRPPARCLPTRPPRRFERAWIERWLEASDACPTTGQRLPRPVALVPNYALRGAIQAWAQEHGVVVPKVGRG